MISGATLIPIAAAAAGSIAGQLLDTVKQPFARLLESPSERAKNEPTAASPQLGSLATQASDQVRFQAIRQNIDQLCVTIHAELANRCSATGVDLSEPMALSIDSEGRILEVGGHLDRDKIELLLETDQELAGQIRQVFRHSQALLDGSTVSESEDSSAPQLFVDQQRAFMQVI